MRKEIKVYIPRTNTKWIERELKPLFVVVGHSRQTRSNDANWKVENNQKQSKEIARGDVQILGKKIN